MQPDLTLYWSPQSQPSRAVKSLLTAGNIKHKSVQLDLLTGENRSPEQLKMNPGGTVPYIQIDGETFIESATILRYLANKYPELHCYYPDNNETRLTIDAGLDFSGQSLRGASLSTWQPFLMRAAGQEPPAEVKAACTENEKKLRTVYEQMNGML